MMFRRRMELICGAVLISCLIESSKVQAKETEAVVIQVPNSEPFQVAAERNITIVGDEFMMNGEPLRIISGSLHYFRVPAAYWRKRLSTLKAAGLNTVSTYVEWSYHEPEERHYDFEGDRDVAQFVRTAAEVGLHVLLRPGPYICAERDLGGLPYWLLGKYPEIRLRTTNKDFINETKIWFDKLFVELTPLLFGNGGPVILVQVENEYGSYGKDMAYKEQIRDLILSHVGNKALLYTTDGTIKSMIEGGMVAGALTTIDFGAGYQAKQVFKTLRTIMPRGPLMNSEFYPGWLTHWGEKLQHVSTDSVVKSLRDLLDNGINVNFYMFFGGTNFELTAGANYIHRYDADITSYDYDAPMSEAGDPTPKFNAIRELLKQYNPELKNIAAPIPSKKGAYGKVTVTRQMNLLCTKGRATWGKDYHHTIGKILPTFEQLRQRSGLMLYETVLNKDESGVLRIQKPRDWIYVFVDSEFIGIISRRHRKMDLTITSKPGSVLRLLVENLGRINYGPLLHDFKGILSYVTFNNQAIDGVWNITGYPLDTHNDTEESYPEEGCPINGPVLYESYFTLPEGEEPLETFIDTTGWRKGYIWINGKNLGRYWPIFGPQVTLYVPGVWLKPAPALNHLRILELEQGPEQLTMEFIDYPILNRTSRVQLDFRGS